MLATVLALTLAASLPLPPDVAPGTKIVAIEVQTFNVFDTNDPGTSSWPYRAANALHIVSREAYVKSLLLFKVGDAIDPAKIAESERLLRATGFLNPVNITVHKADGGARVVVETHDQWTLELSANFGQVGNRRKTGVALSEQNFLGWGKTVEIDSRSDSERNSLTVAYRDPLFFGTHWQLDVAHRDASDGTADNFSMAYPFYALATPYAGGGEWKRETVREYLYADGHRAVWGDAEHRALRAWAGIKLPGSTDAVNRLTLGVFTDRDSFARWQRRDGTPYPDPENRTLQGVEVGWEHQADRWRVIEGFRSWQRQEDIPLGPNWSVRAGISVPALGGDRRRVKLSADGLLARLDGRWYSWLGTSVSGRLEGTGVANGVLHLEVGTAHTGHSGWRGRLVTDVSRDLDRDVQLTLGADTGLRGWDPDTFDGTSRFVGNIEYRHKLTGEVLHLLVIGATGFVDFGQTWNPRVGRSTGGVRADAGVGLQAEITRAAILRVVRLEVAWPDDGSGPVILATGGSLF